MCVGWEFINSFRMELNFPPLHYISRACECEYYSSHSAYVCVLSGVVSMKVDTNYTVQNKDKMSTLYRSLEHAHIIWGALRAQPQTQTR